jgi:3-hydroxyisobutyrate dehydrogenase-like beta-hydroxyacid dehydrogenase
MNIGWIGLGGIGKEMAKRLLGAGYPVTVYTRGQGLAEAKAAGAATSSSYAEIAAASDLFILCVYSDAQLREVLYDGGALAALKPGAVVAIHTTGSPALARELGERAPAGVKVLDATFSGGAADVVAARLTLIVGGEAEVLERARPALATYANHIHHVGPLGAGQTLKLLNNLLFSANLMNTTETLRLAEQQGFDTAEVARVFQTCSGGSFAINLFLPRPQGSPPMAAVVASARPYLEKDVAAAVAAADDAGLDISAFASTVDYYRPDPDPGA